MPYATVAEFKAVSDMTDSKWDDRIQDVLDAAEETIDQYCNRMVSFVAPAVGTVRSFGGSGKAWLRVYDFVAASLVEYKTDPTSATWVSLAAADWIAFSGDHRQPDFDSTPFTAVMLTSATISQFCSGERNGVRLPTVRITARWGYAATVPPQVKEATLSQASRWFKRGQSSWADTLANGDMGMLQYRKVLDPDIQMMLTNARLIRPAL